MAFDRCTGNATDPHRLLVTAGTQTVGVGDFCHTLTFASDYKPPNERGCVRKRQGPMKCRRFLLFQKHTRKTHVRMSGRLFLYTGRSWFGAGILKLLCALL